MSLEKLLECSPFPSYRFEEIEFVSEIGSGANGVVYKCIVRDQYYAVKEYNLSDWGEDEEGFYEALDYELKVLHRVSGLKYTVDTYGISHKKYKDNTQILIIMELLVSIGDLFDFTQKDHFWKFCEDDLEEDDLEEYYVTFYPDENDQHFIYTMNKSIKKKITLMLLEGLIEFHLKNVIHADIKSANIVYSQTGNKKVVKFIDFGASYFSKKNPINIDSRCGTVGYTAPEQYTHKLHKKSDVYSLVVTIIEVWNGEIWGEGDDYKHCREELLEALKRIKKFHPSFGAVLQTGLKEDLSFRPNALKLFHHVKEAFKHDRI
jgi:serine/threonine protein kinase